MQAGSGATVKGFKLQDLATVVLVVGGLGILAWAWANPRSGPEPEPVQPLGPQDEVRSVALDDLLAPQTFEFNGPLPPMEHADVLAVFVMTASACGTCLNEVFEYTHLIWASNHDHARIEPMVLILDEDEDRSARMLRLTNFPVIAGHGYSPDVGNQLGVFADDTLVQQVVFVDVHKEVAFFRALLQSSTTPLETKDAVMQAMIAAWDSLPA